jgi:hypothetical protein
VRRSKVHPVFPGSAMRMSVRSSHSARVRRAVVLLKEPPSTDAALPRDRCVFALSGMGQKHRGLLVPFAGDAGHWATR